MAEKVGKGFSLPKSSLKSPAHLKGKDDSPAKSKNGRKVQFDSEGDWGKGGKGDKVANGGKSSMPKGSSTSGQKNEQELPKNAKCLMDCEAADIVQGIQEQMVVLSEDPTIKIPMPLKAHGVSDSEICMIANICPESLDEVFALIPSFKGKKNKVTQPLKDALSELTKLKQSTQSSN
ncbi:hypothetical protein RHMOL_Rhmol08G0290700 [Rhododendron molle]|uniref:Uncharacterized protein n=2 Tax=Rhododendron molle TaxID=49168 RepID=A0ACC0MVN3_RHOML|nr:hypothetical protein RHMOL_Rhmol08G0290700 [Rhododendron molle]KAI8544364.1 hypothetical protein RHMOL_Rhmol08G0290700 [Rhododendron molle]